MPFFVCLGLRSHRDDIRPEQMRYFALPPNKGLYIHPGTWHNGVQTPRRHGPQTFFTRQGRVHARISVNWATEFNCLLRMPLTLLSP